MSIFTSFDVGVSGLQAQSAKLDVLSQNLANTSTVGFKSSVVNFADLIASDTVTDYSPGGVQTAHTDLNSQQGDITAGDAPTEMAISGNGFFAVSQNPQSGGDVVYTRAGSFLPDASGNLVNGAGYYLQGWPLDSNGNLPAGVSSTTVSSGTAIAALQPVNVNVLNETPTATSAITLRANLDSQQAVYSGTPAYDPTSSTANMASGSIASQFKTPVKVVDSNGTDHSMTLGFLKTGINTWAVEAYVQPSTDVTGVTNGQVAAGTVTFNGDGSLASVSPSLSQISINWANGAAPSTVSMDLGTAGPIFGTAGATSVGRTDGLSQTASTSLTTGLNQNGIDAGTLTGISVTSDGYVQASYSNSTSRNLYKVPLANFTNPDGLTSISGNIYTQSEGAGVATFAQPGQGGVGKLEGDSLESSNEDEATDLTNLEVSQQAYQDNTKTITTDDTMLQDLISMGAT